MCGWCKLNAAALDTTVACGYNGIDQHNLGLLPPIAGIDRRKEKTAAYEKPIAPPSRGLIQFLKFCKKFTILLPPIAGIDIGIAATLCVGATIAPHCGD